MEQIALREIANAMTWVCVAAGGIEREELLRESLRCFGGQRATPGIRSRLDQALAYAESAGMVVEADGLVRAQVD